MKLKITISIVVIGFIAAILLGFSRTEDPGLALYQVLLDDGVENLNGLELIPLEDFEGADANVSVSNTPVVNFFEGATQTPSYSFNLPEDTNLVALPLRESGIWRGPSWFVKGDGFEFSRYPEPIGLWEYKLVLSETFVKAHLDVDVGKKGSAAIIEALAKCGLSKKEASKMVMSIRDELLSLDDEILFLRALKADAELMKNTSNPRKAAELATLIWTKDDSSRDLWEKAFLIEDGEQRVYVLETAPFLPPNAAPAKYLCWIEAFDEGGDSKWSGCLSNVPALSNRKGIEIVCEFISSHKQNTAN